MRSGVEFVIYFYIFICVTLLLFNILYILRSGWVKKKRSVRIARWVKAMGSDPAVFVMTDETVRRLRHINELTAFSAALNDTIIGTPGAARFFKTNCFSLQKIALAYQKKRAMERAFVAYFIASFRTSDADNQDMLAEIMLSYLDNSTVFCRENVLQALYALGRPRAVEHAFDILNEKELYHNPKLLSDGLIRFTGDREALAERLWHKRMQWEEPLNVGVVQFAAALDSETLDPLFYDSLIGEHFSEEVSFALVRYFQRHRYEPARAYLQQLLREDGPLAIPAGAALANYPGEDTKTALKEALTSRNWYIRRNAALSLERLGISEEDREEIRAGGDRYAAEMLRYAEDRARAARLPFGKEAQA